MIVRKKHFKQLEHGTGIPIQENHVPQFCFLRALCLWCFIGENDKDFSPWPLQVMWLFLEPTGSIEIRQDFPDANCTFCSTNHAWEINMIFFLAITRVIDNSRLISLNMNRELHSVFSQFPTSP